MLQPVPRPGKGPSRALDLPFSGPSPRISSPIESCPEPVDIELSDHQVQLAFRDAFPDKLGYHPFSDDPTDPLPKGVVAEISRLHSNQGTALPWDIPPIDRTGLDCCQYRQLISYACTVINQYAHSARYQDLYPAAHDLADRLYRYTSKRWGIYAFSPRQCIRPAQAALDYTHIPGNEPSEEGFREWQRENGEASGRARRSRCSERDRFIIDANAAGLDGTEIASECAIRWPHLGHSPSTISRVLTRNGSEHLARTITGSSNDFNNLDISPDIKSSPGILEGSCNSDDAPLAQVGDAPPQHWALTCWYANVGTYLSVERADRLIEFADRVAAAEEAGNELPNGQGLLWLVDEVIVRRCTTKEHPAAYLMACIDNHGQGLSAELVRDAVQAVGFDFDRKAQYVATADNPVAYLTSLRAHGEAHGGLAGASPMGVGLNALKRWAPELVTPDVEADAQDLVDWERRPGRYLEDYVQRYGRLPWEDPPYLNTSDPEASPRKIPSDAEVELSTPVDPPVRTANLEHTRKPAISAIATENRRDSSLLKALKPIGRDSGFCENAGAIAKLEHRPCRHPLAGMLTSGMSLDVIERVHCAKTGCACALYSDRGRIQCPCHWPAAKAAAAGRTLQAQLGGMVR